MFLIEGKLRKVGYKNPSTFFVYISRIQLYKTGEYLIKAGQYKNASYLLSVASGVSFFLLSSKNKDNNNNDLAYIVGGTFGISSIICYFVGNSYLIKAGKELQIQATTNSIGIAVHF